MQFGRLGAGFGKIGSRGKVNSIIPGLITAGAGSYAWSGDTMAPIVDHIMPAGAGSYAWTGQDATLTPTSSFSLAWTAHAEDAAGGTTVNYGTLSIGAPHANRIVVVAIFNRANITGGTVTSVTVGGVSATQVSGAVADTGAGLVTCDMWQAAVTTGTTATVSITYANLSARSGINLYRIVTATPTRTAAVQANSASCAANGALTSPSITVPSGGAMISVYGHRVPGNANDISWTNATKDYTAIQIGTAATCGSATTTAAGSTTISASISGAGSGTSVGLSVAAWGP